MDARQGRDAIRGSGSAESPVLRRSRKDAPNRSIVPTEDAIRKERNAYGSRIILYTVADSAITIGRSCIAGEVYCASWTFRLSGTIRGGHP